MFISIDRTIDAHDIEFAHQHADCVIALGNSEVLLDDTPCEVFGQLETLAETDVDPLIVTRIGN